MPAGPALTPYSNPHEVTGCHRGNMRGDSRESQRGNREYRRRQRAAARFPTLPSAHKRKRCRRLHRQLCQALPPPPATASPNVTTPPSRHSTGTVQAAFQLSRECGGERSCCCLRGGCHSARMNAFASPDRGGTPLLRRACASVSR